MNQLNFESGREFAQITLTEEGAFHVMWGGDDCGGEFTATSVGDLIDSLPFFLSVEQFAQLRAKLFFN